MKYLLYTLVNFKIKPYIEIFKQFLQSLVYFSDISKFELCVITDEITARTIKKLSLIKSFPNVSYVIVPVNATLETALFRKFDITKHPEFLTYDKILFLDCDILVIQDVMKLFKNIKVNKDKLHVAQEGSLKEPYWRLNAFAQNISTMILQDKQSFNSGEFIFKPSANMKRHFEQAKEFGLTKSHTKFYDQPVFNYYFNKHNLVVMCPYLSKKLQLFPDPSKQYHNKILLHFTGIGRYEEKAPMMKRYLAEFILSQNH